MTSDKRRAAGRRRAWGRGPIILRFEPLESRELLTAAATVALPDLTGQSFQTPTSLAWGSTFNAQGVVVNQGNAATTKSFQVDIYASPTPVVGSDAVLLGAATVASGLQVGGQSAYSDQVTLPSTPLADLGPSGSFYIAAVINPQGSVVESNMQNNADMGDGIDYQLVTQPADTSASLIGTGLSLSASETSWGGSIQLTEQVTNNGTADAPATRAVVYLTPSGTTPGTSADFSLGSIAIPAIPAGQSVTVTPSINLPSTPPSLFSGVSDYTLSVVQDADYITNQIYPHTASQGVGYDQAALTITTPSYASASTADQPELEVTSVTADSQDVLWGKSFQVAYTIENAGSAAAGPTMVRFLLTGPGGSTADALFLEETTLTGLAAGASQTYESMLTLPASVPGGQTLNSSGTGAVSVIVDPEYTIDETRTGIEGVSQAIQLGVVNTDGSTSSLIATPTPTPTPTATAKATVKPKVAVKAVATKAVKAEKAVATPAEKKAAALKKADQHTLSHNLKVIPRDVENYFKRTFNIK